MRDKKRQGTKRQSFSSSYCGCLKDKTKLSKALKELYQVFLTTEKGPPSIALASSAGQVHALSAVKGQNNAKNGPDTFIIIIKYNLHLKRIIQKYSNDAGIQKYIYKCNEDDINRPELQ